MAEVSGLDMVREIIGQINNLRRLVTINGKKFKWDGKKYVRAVDGKTFTKKELVSYVKDEKFTAPKTPKVRKPSEELKTTKITKDSKGRRVVDPEGNKLKIKRQDIKGDIKNKVKSVTSNIKKTTGQTVNKGNQILQNLKLRIGQPNADSTTTRALKINKYLRGLNPTTVAGGLAKGGANLGIGMGADWLANQAVDRTFRALSGNNKMSLDEYRAMIAQRLANPPTRGTNQQIQPTVTRNRRGRVTSTQQPVGRNWQNPEMGPPQPKVSYEPEEVVTPPNQGTDSTKEETVDKVKVKKVKFNPNAPDMGYDTKKTKKKKKDKNKDLMIGDKKASSIQKKLLKAGFTEKELKTLVDAYDEKYRSKRGW